MYSSFGTIINFFRMSLLIFSYLITVTALFFLAGKYPVLLSILDVLLKVPHEIEVEKHIKMVSNLIDFI